MKVGREHHTVGTDSREVWIGAHSACAAAFPRAMAGYAALPTKAMLATAHATIEAAAGVGRHD
jgi:hypothetical protein